MIQALWEICNHRIVQVKEIRDWFHLWSAGNHLHTSDCPWSRTSGTSASSILPSHHGGFYENWIALHSDNPKTNISHQWVTRAAPPDIYRELSTDVFDSRTPTGSHCRKNTENTTWTENSLAIMASGPVERRLQYFILELINGLLSGCFWKQRRTQTSRERAEW